MSKTNELISSSTTTMRFLLNPTPEQVAKLHEALHHTRLALNHISLLNSQHINTEGVVAPITNYNKMCATASIYTVARSASVLKSSQIQQCMKQVAGSFKSNASRRRKLQAKITYLEANNKKVYPKTYKQLDKLSEVCPDYSGCNSMQLVAADFTEMTNEHIRVSTVGKGYEVIALATNKFNNQQLMDMDVRTVRSGRLVFRNNRWYIHVTTQHLSPPSGGVVVGIDLGITDLVSTSLGTHQDQDRYHAYQQRMQRHASHVSSLQANGSRNAKRRLKRISGRRARITHDYTHCTSKQVVADVRKSLGTVIVLERLTNIRTNRKKSDTELLHSWCFHKLSSQLEYKAIKAGLHVVYVNPAHTSTTCSKCKSTDTTRSGKLFTCHSCDTYISDADINAACNIRDRAGLGSSVSSHTLRKLRLAHQLGKTKCVSNITKGSSTS